MLRSLAISLLSGSAITALTLSVTSFLGPVSVPLLLPGVVMAAYLAGPTPHLHALVVALSFVFWSLSSGLIALPFVHIGLRRSHG